MNFRKVRHLLRKLFLSLFIPVALLGCAERGIVIADPYPSAHPKIPKGHMPPPGMCRIWYPNLPPGQQPPPGDCSYLRHHVPPGAWLIRG